ncbi:unnamed protein product, partial [Clonostachys chloroleuca]
MAWQMLACYDRSTWSPAPTCSTGRNIEIEVESALLKTALQSDVAQLMDRYTLAQHRYICFQIASLCPFHIDRHQWGIQPGLDLVDSETVSITWLSRIFFNGACASTVTFHHAP